MLARGALHRLAAGVPKTPTPTLPQLAALLQRALLARNASKLPAVRAISRAYASAIESRRSYATTARATKPTETVKKAVKAKAAKKAVPRKRAAPATTTKKKVVAKKVVAKKAAGKKAAPKKTPTPEQKERAVLIELRKKALKAPVGHRTLTAFNAYMAEVCTRPASTGQKRASTQVITDASRSWKTLTPAEHEHYNHLANEKTEARRAELQAWVNSHPPGVIRIANLARATLRKKLRGKMKSARHPANTEKIYDDRHVKRPLSPYVLFSTERWASGDLKGISTVDAARLLGNEWKALSASEKKKYEDESKANKETIARERAAALT